MINNRQAGRRRGRGGGNNGQRQGGNQGNGSRIDNRARGNASQLYEKYKNMAADAQRAGDRVNTEYYLQFADHYFRVLSEQRGRFEDQQQRPRRDEFDVDGDEEFGDEGEPIGGREQLGEQPDGNRFDVRDGRPREERGRDDRPREDRPQRDFRRDENSEQPRRREWQDRDRNVQDRGWDRGQDRQDRPDRNAQDRQRERRPYEAPAEVAGQHRADAVAPGESLAGRADEVLNADRPLEPPVRRRGRPRREDVGEVNGFEADRLPPAISPSLTLAANDETAEPKPRRRRARPAEDTPTAAE